MLQAYVFCCFCIFFLHLDLPELPTLRRLELTGSCYLIQTCGPHLAIPPPEASLSESDLFHHAASDSQYLSPRFGCKTGATARRPPATSAVLCDTLPALHSSKGRQRRSRIKDRSSSIPPILLPRQCHPSAVDSNSGAKDREPSVPPYQCALPRPKTKAGRWPCQPASVHWCRA